MTLNSGKLMYSDGNNDECYTPAYGVTPILKYIPKDAIVWCPFDTSDSEFVKQISKQNETIWTDEMRRAKSEWRKKLHEEHPEMHPNRKLSGNRSSMSYPERVAYEFLQSLGIEFEYQKRVIGFYPDFVVGIKIIEIDGERWHNSEKDVIRDKKLNDEGFEVYRTRFPANIDQSTLHHSPGLINIDSIYLNQRF